MQQAQGSSERTRLVVGGGGTVVTHSGSACSSLLVLSFGSAARRDFLRDVMVKAPRLKYIVKGVSMGLTTILQYGR